MKIFTGLTYKSILSFTIISDVYRSFIPNKTTFPVLLSGFHRSQAWQIVLFLTLLIAIPAKREHYNETYTFAKANQIQQA